MAIGEEVAEKCNSQKVAEIQLYWQGNIQNKKIFIFTDF